MLKKSIIQLLLLFIPFYALAQTGNIDSIKNVIENTSIDTIKVNSFTQLAMEYYSSNKDSALKYSQKALELSERINYKKGLNESYGWVAFLYNLKGNSTKALFYYNKRLKINQEQGDNKAISVAYNNIGNIYERQGVIEKALEYYHKSLKIKEDIGNSDGVAFSLHNIATIYQNQRDYDKALSYYKKSLKISEKNELKKLSGETYNSIGIIYEKNKNLSKALKNFEKSLTINNSIDDKIGIARSLNNIGNIHRLNNNLTKALEYFEQSLVLRREIKDKQGISFSLNKIGYIYYERENYKKALVYANESLDISKELGYPDNLRAVSSLLKDIYLKQKNYSLAYFYYDMNIKMRDSIYNEKTQKASISQDFKYKYEKIAIADSIEHAKQQEIKNLKISEQNLLIEQDQTRLIILSVVIILLLIIAFYIYRGFRNKQKTNIILQTQKEEIADKNQKLTDSIKYAERIQNAVLPDEKEYSEIFKDYFIYYKPRNIVSGDFYIITKTDKNTVVAAVDCTGHGVPGAFMSMLGISFLNDILRRESVTKASQVLNELRDKVIYSLKQKAREKGEKTKLSMKDGMDMALISINHQTNILQFSGANNPLYIVKGGKLKVESEMINAIKEFELDKLSTLKLYEIRPNKMPIAIYEKMNKFTNHEIQLEKGDKIYLFTDGYADQFGGKKNKKFMYKQFKELLLKNSQLTMKEQKELLDITFNSWKGNQDQVDDILIIGIEV